MAERPDILSWLHIGDLHIASADAQNYRDLLRIVDAAPLLAPGSIDFAVLPGDNADDGTPEQFALVRDAVARLSLPLHVLPGDHDFKPRTLDAFHTVLGAQRLPKSIIVTGHRCLFLDVVSAGTGGPDFRLGEEQLAWTERELDQAEAAGQDVVIFMHSYPADLREGAERLGMLLDRPWPFVLITRPVERRLVTGPNRATPSPFVVRAKIIGDAPIETVELRADGGIWAPMAPVPGAPALWEASASPATRFDVRARDALGRIDEDRVEPPGPDWTPPARRADGSDGDRVGAWPEKGIFDTQLGPNRNGRKW